jgi:hypothetical protein
MEEVQKNPVNSVQVINVVLYKRVTYSHFIRSLLNSVTQQATGVISTSQHSPTSALT